jgi:hypothetical protein
VGCDFVRQFTPHDGGWCRVHGNIAPIPERTPKRDMGQETVIERLGGNELSLLEDANE